MAAITSSNAVAFSKVGIFGKFEGGAGRRAGSVQQWLPISGGAGSNQLRGRFGIQLRSKTSFASTGMTAYNVLRIICIRVCFSD